MGKRGPRPLPTAEKVRRGNPGKRPLNKREPKPANAKPTQPRWMRHAAKRQWQRIAQDLHDAGLLTRIDQTALAMLCETYATYVEAMQIVEEQGMVAISEKGSPYQHPAVGIMNQARKELRGWLQEFGMTPSARTGLVVSEADQSLADVLFGELS